MVRVREDLPECAAFALLAESGGSGRKVQGVRREWVSGRVSEWESE